MMQVSVETTGPLERAMRVEVPEERIADEVQKRLQDLARTAKIQGFRPGKVPFKLVQRRFGAKVRQEVVGEVVQSTFYEALSREKLRPAAYPNLDPVSAEQGAGLHYTAKFEVFPEVELAPIEGLKIEKALCSITDEDLDKMIEVLRRQRRRPQQVARAAQKEDLVDIDFVGKVDGEAFEGGEAKAFKVEIGSGRLIEGFEEALVGKQAGDKATLKLAFPEDYPKQALAGRPVEFAVTVNSVHEQVWPQLDEAFFADFGVEEGGEAAFRKEISQHMHREAEAAIRRRLRDAVMDGLYAANELELPRALVEKERQNMAQQFKQNMKSHGLPVDNDNTMPGPELFEQQARKRVALQLLIAEIIRENELKAEPARVREWIEKNAQGYEDPAAIVNWYYQDKQRLAEVEALALEEEVIDWIFMRAQITEVHLGFDDLMNKGQTKSPLRPPGQ